MVSALNSHLEGCQKKNLFLLQLLKWAASFWVSQEKDNYDIFLHFCTIFPPGFKKPNKKHEKSRRLSKSETIKSRIQCSQSNSRHHWDLRRGCLTVPRQQPWTYPQQAVGSLHSRGKRQAGDLLCDFGWSCWTPASQSHRCLVTKEQSISHKPRQTWRSLKVRWKQAYSMCSSISWKMLLATTWGANLGRFLVIWWGTAFPADGRGQDNSQTPFLREKRAGRGCRAELGSLKDRLGIYEGQPSLEKAAFQAVMLLTQCCW